MSDKNDYRLFVPKRFYVDGASYPNTRELLDEAIEAGFDFERADVHESMLDYKIRYHARVRGLPAASLFIEMPEVALDRVRLKPTRAKQTMCLISLNGQQYTWKDCVYKLAHFHKEHTSHWPKVDKQVVDV